ncbi:MAG: hypothetical protein IJO48_07305, partial [Clostridia bacterium]|nr:hypothetical protein [Clostridia bacterium]
MKNRLKHLFITLLVLSVLLSSFSPCFALGETSGKEEVVYSNLKNDGTVEKVYVVNIFNVIKPGTLLDYGNYSSVLNLTDTSPLALNGRKIVLAPSAPGRFYYQGYTESLDLPWNISITYSLDGQAILPEALGGQSGNLVINIKTTPNENVDPSFFEKYMLQATVTLNTEKCANIVCDQATFANAGKNKLLTLMLLPGTNGDITITTDVVNFEMESITINGVSFKLALDSGLIDSSQFSQNFGILTDGVSQLYDGALQLENGAKQLSDGLSQFREGTGRLTSGASALTKGMNELADGIFTVSDKVDEIYTTIDSMTSSSSSLEAGLDKIADAVLKDANSRLEDIYGEAAPTMTWESYRAVLQDLSSKSNNSELRQILASLDSVDALIAQLMEHSDEIRAGAKELRKGINELNNGAKELASGAKELSSGINELNNGIVALDDGALSLYQGMTQLREGIGALKDGTSGIDGEVESTISTMLSELAGEDFVPTSFTAKINDNVTAVQFVLKTGSIKSPESSAP